MAQSALTVTPENPTPPTNLSFIGLTPPDPLNYDPLIYQAASNDPLHPNDPHYPQYGSAPFFDDGMTYPEPNPKVFAANHATVPISTGLVSTPHEGAGTELAVTWAGNPVTYNPYGAQVMVSTGLPLTPGVLPSPNATHASSLSGSAVPTVSAASGASNASGPGTTLLTVTGTNFNRASVVTLNGARQTTNFASPTSLTVTNAQKAASAGTLPVAVISNGVTTAPVNWTLT